MSRNRYNQKEIELELLRDTREDIIYKALMTNWTVN